MPHDQASDALVEACVLILIITLLVKVCSFVAGAPPIGTLISRMYGDDRSMFVHPDANDWPGDALSEKQVNTAIKHFYDPDICKRNWHPWRWALIGPHDFLLIGTRYRVEQRFDAGIPNVGMVKGFWGGEVLGLMPFPLSRAKGLAEEKAADECDNGIQP